MTTETTPTAPPNYPIARACGRPLDPPDEYALWRAESSGISRISLWDGRPVWLVTGFEAAQALLADDRLRTDRTNPAYPVEAPTHAAGPTRIAFRSMDGPQHAFYRRMLAKSFSAPTISAMLPKITATIDELIGSMKAKGSPGDLFQDLALPLAMKITCELLGVPYEDQAKLDRWVNLMLGRHGDASAFSDAAAGLSTYMLDLIDKKTADPVDDLISRMATGALAAGDITREDAMATVMLLLLGGYESTAATISSGVLTLVQYPEQLERVRRGLAPDELNRLVEEVLRFTSVTDAGADRYAAEDIDINGTHIEAGDGVVFHLPSINRDESTFPDPNRFDLDREGPRHQAFGHGKHQCVGQSLARAEIREAIPTVAAAFTNLRLVQPPEELDFRTSSLIYSVLALPVAWDD